MRAELWLSLKYLQKHKKTPAFFISILALAGIVLGVAALILVISVMSGFDREVKEKLLGFNYHMVSYFKDASSENVDVIASHDEVDSAVLYAEIQTAVRFNKQIAPVMLYAVDYNDTERQRWNKFLKNGDLSGVVLGKILYQRLGLEIGDQIEVFNPDTSKLNKFTVTGFFEVGLFDIDDMVVAIPAHSNEKFENALAEAWSVGARLKNPDKATVVKSELYTMDIEDLRYVTTWIDRNRTLFTWLRLEKIGAFIVLSFIVIVAAFNIFATQSIRVVEKTKDIGILKTIGLSRGGICLMFCLQGMVIGVLGTLLGLLCGLGLCYVVGYTDLIPLPAELYHIEHIPVLLNYNEIALICGVAFVMTFVFSIFPAIKAASFKVVDAISYE